MKKHIPNIITLFNLLSGVFSIYFGFSGNLKLAGLMIFVAAIFDFFDGFMARLLNARSNIGLQLDSLADMVSFGVAPAFVLFQTIRLPEVLAGNNNLIYLSFSAFLIPLFAALRLAKFNIDENQTTSFVGMPTPAVAIFFASLPIVILICLADNPGFYFTTVTNPWFLSVSGVVFSLLMVSKIPMFSLKFKSASWPEHQTQYIFLILSVFLLIILKIAAIPLIILLYLILSLVFYLINESKTEGKKG